jgi:hypothetical protein
MKFFHLLRLTTVAIAALLLLFNAVGAQARPGNFLGGTIPPLPPTLHNADFECTVGYTGQIDAKGKEIFVPNGWQLTTLLGAPMIHSARIFFAKSCDGSAHVERINGIDSIVIRAEDLETPPEPGKPFDVAFQQQISATVGGAYSLSGWMLSLCGGSAVPSDCPADVHIAKLLGIDPTGGTDPSAATVIWTENRRNFWENGQRIGWQQLSVSTIAQAETITIFARINSPSRWHGNHAFIDALSIVRAPVTELLAPATVTGTTVALLWQGELFPEITGQSGSTHQLLFDIESRHQAAATWQRVASGKLATESVVFTATCTNTNYLFRIRGRAEQPADVDGAWPNHRYPGVWSDPFTIRFQRPTPALENTQPVSPTISVDHQLFLPFLADQKPC